MPRNDLLSFESPVARPFAPLAVVWHDVISAIRLRCWLGKCGDDCEHLVPGAKGVLLCSCGPRLPDHSFAGAHTDGPAHPVPDTAAYAAAHATHAARDSAGHAACDSASDIASCTTHDATQAC